MRVSGEQREALSPKETLSSDIPRTIRLHPGTTVLDLTALVERLAANTDQVPIILLTDTAKEKSLNTLMPAAPFDSTQRRQLLPSPSTPGFRMPSRDPP